MSRFNTYFNTHFGGCTCLAHAYDPHRQRNVRIFMIPGVVDVVGVSDTVDCWIAPNLNTLFDVDIPKIMREVHDGLAPKLPVIGPGIPGESATGKRARTRVLVEGDAIPPTRPRSRVLVDPGEPETPVRIRRRANI